MRVKGQAVLRRPPTARSRLQSQTEALELVATVLDADPHTTALVVVDRRPPHEGLVACCTEPLTLADLDQLDACILDAALVAEAGCRMVLATRRPPFGEGVGAGAGGADAIDVVDDIIDEADLELWRRLQARHATSGVPLLDWFQIAGASVRSLAELAGPRARWRDHR